ncbi:hypothetical protein AVEN_255367-1 [Araneus ventricosus]|uniref:Uncharacterized protein n=1 Tax=Araneus ventricosus TaxID=182803 RepID=A0A4Y2U1W0_ARAVE|nr:hypothetical protein AVEN_255367-1 [Araneus ventricosus]
MSPVQFLVEEDSQVFQNANSFEPPSVPENGGTSSEVAQQQEVCFFDSDLQIMFVRPGLEGRQGFRRQTTQSSLAACRRNDKKIIGEGLDGRAWRVL